MATGRHEQVASCHAVMIRVRGERKVGPSDSPCSFLHFPSFLLLSFSHSLLSQRGREGGKVLVFREMRER